MANLGELSVSLTAQDAQFKAAMRSAERAVSDLGKAAANTRLLPFALSLELVKKAAMMAGRAFAAVTDAAKTPAFTQAASRMEDAFGGLKTAIGESITESDAFIGVMHDVAGAIDTVASRVAPAIAKMRGLYDAFVRNLTIARDISDGVRIAGEGPDERRARRDAFFAKEEAASAAARAARVRKNREGREVMLGPVDNPEARAGAVQTARDTAARRTEIDLEFTARRAALTKTQADDLEAQMNLEIHRFKTGSDAKILSAKKEAEGIALIRSEFAERARQSEDEARAQALEASKAAADARAAAEEAALADQVARNAAAQEQIRRNAADAMRMRDEAAAAGIEAGTSFAAGLIQAMRAKTAGEKAKAVFSTILRIAGSAVSLVNPVGGAAISGAGTILSALHSGGPVRYAHAGMAPPRVGEVDIRAQVGEGVVSRQGMLALGLAGLDGLNRGQAPGANVTFSPSVVINASGGDAARDFDRKLDRALQGAQSRFIRQLERHGVVKGGGR